MPLTILVGAQWGDEGKGRIVDLMAANTDYVARYNGGDNAGHTVTVGSQTFKLHLIPSGIIHPQTVGVMGNGMVINPHTLFAEIDMLRAAGVEINPQRLRISYAAHLITPAHRALDKAQEQARGHEQIGTTGRGIGPAYTDKASRRGLRLMDMLNPGLFEEQLIEHTHETNRMLTTLYQSAPLEVDQLTASYMDYARQLTPYIADTSSLLGEALAQEQRVLAEGAQGTLLDLDLGTYPFVTSSFCTAPSVLTGLGLGIMPVEAVVGVTKSFQTRVGSGPFPTEVFGATAERLRGTGANPWDEFGTTTGRPRRVGWLDGVLLRYAVRVNGLTELALTKLDILSGLEKVRLCVGYTDNGQRVNDLPMGPANLAPYEPIYAEMPGWEDDLRAVRRWQDLPIAARTYLEQIEALAGIPVKVVSVGPERSQVITHHDP